MAKVSSPLGWVLFLLVVAGAVAYALHHTGSWGGFGEGDDAPDGQGRALLVVTPDAPQAKHAYSFTLGRPATLSVTIDNPKKVAGTVRVGPPAPQGPRFTSLDDRYAKTHALDAAATAAFSWTDLTVGTRVVLVELNEAAPIGVEVRSAGED